MVDTTTNPADLWFKAFNEYDKARRSYQRALKRYNKAQALKQQAFETWDIYQFTQYNR